MSNSDPSRSVEGACLCGAVRFSRELPTRFVAHCHCSQCRRAHGSGSVTWAGVPAAQFRWIAGEALLSHFDTATGATRSFCSRCGSTLTFRSPRWPDEVHATVANVEGDLDRAPQAHAYADRAPAWYPIHDDLPRLGGTEGDEPL